MRYRFEYSLLTSDLSRVWKTSKKAQTSVDNQIQLLRMSSLPPFTSYFMYTIPPNFCCVPLSAFGVGLAVLLVQHERGVTL